MINDPKEEVTEESSQFIVEFQASGPWRKLALHFSCGEGITLQSISHFIVLSSAAME